MSVSFATPLGALAALALVLPLLGALAARRRASRVRAALGLPRPGRSARLSWTAALGVLFLLLGLAAAQPVVAAEGTLEARVDAEAYVVVDTSRSMLAAGGPEGASRFERASDLARSLRARLPEVRTGLASLTDRALPHLFPTADRRAFELVLAEALAIDRPPPLDEARVATDFAALRRLAEHNFFSPRAVHRLAVLVSDGESRPFELAVLARALDAHGVDLLVVSTWSADERIRVRGAEDYRPDPRSRAPLAALAAATAGGRVFDEREVSAIAAAARAALGHGPVAAEATGPRLTPLAPYFVLVAGIPLAFLLAARGGQVGWRVESRWA